MRLGIIEIGNVLLEGLKHLWHRFSICLPSIFHGVAWTDHLLFLHSDDIIRL